MSTHNLIMNIDMLLSVAGPAFGLFGLVCAPVAIRAILGWRARCLIVESNLAAVRRELELVASISVKMGRRLGRIEHKYAGLADRVDQAEVRGSAQSFDQAIESARRGADSGTLTRQFGLSCGEADLVTRLHGRKKSA